MQGAIPLLQILRAAAALMVAVLHVGGEGARLSGQPAPPAWLTGIPWNAGVDIFFVVSGFVMVWSSAKLFGRPGARRVFLVRRIARIVPPYWIATTALVLAAALAPNHVSGGPETPASILASYAFIPFRRPDGEIQPVLRLGWTLNYEMLFYAIFALWVAAPGRRACRGVMGTLLALVAVGALLEPRPVPLAFWTSPMLLEFGVGVLIGVAALRGARLGTPARLLLCALGIAGLALAGPLAERWRWIVYALPGAALVAAATLGAPARSGARWFRALVLLGDASFALYLVHPFPMRALSILWRRAFPPGEAASAAYLLVTLSVVLVAAVAFHLWIERPVTRAARRWLGDGSPAPIRAIAPP